MREAGFSTPDCTMHNSGQNAEECPDAVHKPNSGSVTMQQKFHSSSEAGFIKNNN